MLAVHLRDWRVFAKANCRVACSHCALFPRHIGPRPSCATGRLEKTAGRYRDICASLFSCSLFSCCLTSQLSHIPATIEYSLSAPPGGSSPWLSPARSWPSVFCWGNSIPQLKNLRRLRCVGGSRKGTVLRGGSKRKGDKKGLSLGQTIDTEGQTFHITSY